MRKTILSTAIMMLSLLSTHAEIKEPSVIEVTGSATLNIIPDRITIEIGMEEYFRPNPSGDSVVVRLSDIEKGVRKVLGDAGVPDSLVIVSNLGNYRNRDVSTAFLMAKRLSATLSDFERMEYISDRLDRNGITDFNITRIDNSDMARYNNRGLKSALDAARRKAELIAENEGLEIIAPYEIIETSNEPAGYSSFSNVAYDGGSGMGNLRRIVRRYSVKVRYIFSVKQ